MEDTLSSEAAVRRSGSGFHLRVLLSGSYHSLRPVLILSLMSQTVTPSLRDCQSDRIDTQEHSTASPVRPGFGTGDPGKLTRLERTPQQLPDPN